MRREVMAAGTVIALTLGIAPVAWADNGISVRTQSGRMRCEVFANDPNAGGPAVVCQRGDGGSPFPQAPISREYNERENLAVSRGDGAVSWNIGNIPGASQSNDTVLTYGQTYHLNGWTVTPAEDGTRFVNDKTGRGMFVTFDNVSAI